MKLTRLLTDEVIAALVLPEGKLEEIHWDGGKGSLEGFGWRMKRSKPGAQVKCSYVIIKRFKGRSPRHSLDPVVKAKDARAWASRILAQYALGVDVAAEEKRTTAADKITFAYLAEQYLTAKEGTIRPASMVETRRYLTAGSYFKVLHGRPIDSILRKDIAACLLEIAKKHGQVAAARARSALSAMFTWAMQNGLSESNPTIGTARPKAPPSRSRVLSDSELVAVWNAARGDGDDFGKIIRLLILTGQRRSEVGGMRWSEITNDKWTIPSERSKNHREHTVPLGELAREIIASVPVVLDRDCLFGARGDGFTSWAGAKRELDARLGDTVRPWTLHDIRRTVATRMADIGVEPFHVEALLNHVGHKAGVAGVYNRSKYTNAIQKAVAAWDRYLRHLIEPGSVGSNVIDIQPATA
jgi:integrase